jgi:hypothetical protein
MNHAWNNEQTRIRLRLAELDRMLEQLNAMANLALALNDNQQTVVPFQQERK